MNPFITAAVAEGRRDDLIRAAAAYRRAQLVTGKRRLSVRGWLARGYL